MVRTIGIAALLALLVGCAGDDPAGDGTGGAGAAIGAAGADGGGAGGAAGDASAAGGRGGTTAGGTGGMAAAGGAGGHAGAGGATGGSGGAGGGYPICTQAHVETMTGCVRRDQTDVLRRDGLVCVWCDATDASGTKVASPEGCIAPGTGYLCVNPSCGGCS